MEAKYKRVILKISGEALSSPGENIDFDIVGIVAKQVAEISDMGVEVCIIVGGGNIWRGRQGKHMDRVTADHMGMLATVINSLALADGFESVGVTVRVQTAIAMQQIAEPYIRNRAVSHLEHGRLIVLGCGTGSPFFSTDTAAALRAAELDAEVIFKATLVDGVYDSDPHKNPDAKRYDDLSFSEMLNKELGVVDMTAATLCRDQNIPIVVFSLDDPDNILRAIQGERIGTIVH